MTDPSDPLGPHGTPGPGPKGPDRYSRFVSVLKVTLPLVALAMLAALFLTQPDDGDGTGLVFSEADLDALGSGLRIANADFDGTNATGDRFRFRSALVEPDAAPPTRASLSGLTGSVDFKGGPIVDLEADSGEIILATRVLTLTGSVKIKTSDGQNIDASEVVIDLAAGSLTATGGVETGATGGAITSETLRIDPADANGGTERRFSFGNGVRLRYDPAAATR